METKLRNKIMPYKESNQFLRITLDGRLTSEAKTKEALNTIQVVADKKKIKDELW